MAIRYGLLAFVYPNFKQELFLPLIHHLKSWGGYVIIMQKVNHVLCWHMREELKILTVILYEGLSYVCVNKALICLNN
jgi:hypothetical protein